MRWRAAAAALLALLAVWPAARADGLSYAASDVKGVQLWLLTADQEEQAVDKGNEFVRHCDGSGRALLHVGSVASPVRCKSIAMPSGDYRIRLDSGGQKLPRLAVVSLAPLPERTLPPAPSEAELSALAVAEQAQRTAFAASARQAFMQTYGSTPAQYDQQLADIQRSAKYRAKLGQRWKLVTPQGGVLFVAPLGAVPDPMGWDLAYAVFRAAPAGLTAVGQFRGCVEGFRDVDGDGVADVFTATCANDEGQTYAFVSIAGAVQRLMSH